MHFRRPPPPSPYFLLPCRSVCQIQHSKFLSVHRIPLALARSLPSFFPRPLLLSSQRGGIPLRTSKISICSFIQSRSGASCVHFSPFSLSLPLESPLSLPPFGMRLFPFLLRWQSRISVYPAARAHGRVVACRVVVVVAARFATLRLIIYSVTFVAVGRNVPFLHSK